jgi:hypothetical protein
VSWNSLGSESVPADKSYVPTGVTLMGIVAYNKAKVPNPPSTWQALESQEQPRRLPLFPPPRPAQPRGLEVVPSLREPPAAAHAHLPRRKPPLDVL